jgi:hypothetical protein
MKSWMAVNMPEIISPSCPGTDSGDHMLEQQTRLFVDQEHLLHPVAQGMQQHHFGETVSLSRRASNAT